uniref:Uncharacterized protein n=1 Tax=Anopheles minimus TaxID=112268 RepID=A0A182WNV7_9DIPT
MKSGQQELEMSLTYIDPYEGHTTLELQRIHQNLKRNITNQLINNERKFSYVKPQNISKHHVNPQSKKQWLSCRNIFDVNSHTLTMALGIAALLVLYRIIFAQNCNCLCSRPICYGTYSRFWYYIKSLVGFEDTLRY